MIDYSKLTAREFGQLVRKILDPRCPDSSLEERARLACGWDPRYKQLTPEFTKELAQEISANITPQEGAHIIGGYTINADRLSPAFVGAVESYWGDKPGIVSLILSRLHNGLDSCAVPIHVTDMLEAMIETGQNKYSLWPDQTFDVIWDLCEERIIFTKKDGDEDEDSIVDLGDDNWRLLDPHNLVGLTVRTLGVLCYALEARRGSL